MKQITILLIAFCCMLFLTTISSAQQLPGVEDDKVTVDRFNIGVGWFLTRNILTKVEYVSQSYKDYPAGQFEEGEFSGLMIEAVIAF